MEAMISWKRKKCYYEKVPYSERVWRDEEWGLDPTLSKRILTMSKMFKEQFFRIFVIKI